MSAARNAGLDWAFANSKSEYIAFVDSDDWVSQNYLEELLKGVGIADGVACLDCRIIRDEVHEDEIVQNVIWKSLTDEEFWNCAEGFVVTAWGKICKKEFYTDVRFPVGKINEDMYTTYRIIDKVKRVAVSGAKLYNYFQHGQSIMAQWMAHPEDRVNGYLTEIAYLDSKGYDSAAKYYRSQLARTCSVAVAQSPHRDDRVRNRYRNLLRQMMRECKLKFIDSKEQAFAAYPVRARLAWPFVRAYDLVRRRGVVGSVRQWLSHFRRCEDGGMGAR